MEFDDDAMVQMMETEIAFLGICAVLGMASVAGLIYGAVCIFRYMLAI